MALEIFKCNICFKSCDTQGKLNRHLKTHTRPFRCESCPSGFALRLDLERHIKARHRVGNDKHHCHINECYFRSSRKDNLKRHIKRSHASILIYAKSDKSMVNATTTASLPPTIGISSTIESFGTIYSISVFMQAATYGDITTLERLMNFGFTTETRADDQSTVLHCAARNGQANTVLYLLDKGARTDTTNEKDLLPLHEALIGGEMDTITVLIEKKPKEELKRVKLSSENCLGRTKNIEFLQLYMQRLDIELTVQTLDGIFRNAMLAENDTLVAALLHHSEIDPNAFNNFGNAWIHIAAGYDNTKMMELFLDSNRVDKSRTTRILRENALHIAARRGHANIVDQLLYSGFDVNSLNHKGQTPLHYAATWGRSEIITLLVNKWNADLSSQDRSGKTSLLCAAFNMHWKSVHVLLEGIDSKSHYQGVDIQPANREFDKKDAIARLLHHESDPNLSQSFLQQTFLFRAAEKGDLEAIEALLARGKVNVNAMNRSGFSSLMKAARNGHTEAVRLLLQHPQIDVNMTPRWNMTALVLARRKNHQEIVDVLLLHGAVDDRETSPPTITTEDSSSLITAKTGHIPTSLLEEEDEADPEIYFDTFMDGILDFDDISDIEDERME